MADEKSKGRVLLLFSGNIANITNIGNIFIFTGSAPCMSFIDNARSHMKKTS